MYAKGHFGVSMILYAPIVAVLLAINKSFIVFAILGSVLVSSFCTLPDIDMRLKEYNRPFSGDPLVTHRKETHTVVFALLFGSLVTAGCLGVLWYASTLDLPTLSQEWLLLTAFVGMTVAYSILTHIAGDMLTPHGIRPFRPFSKRRYTLNVCLADGEIKTAPENGGNMFSQFVRGRLKYKYNLWGFLPFTNVSRKVPRDWNDILHAIGWIVIIAAFLIGWFAPVSF